MLWGNVILKIKHVKCLVTSISQSVFKSKVREWMSRHYYVICIVTYS